MDPRDVRLVLEQLAAQTTRHLAKGRRVHLDNLGTFTATEMNRPKSTGNIKLKRKVAPRRSMRVSFKQARRLKEELKCPTKKTKA
jgi:nucleoid DNA-binding protein